MDRDEGVYHFDLEVSLLAVMELGQSPGSDPQAAVPALLDATGVRSAAVLRAIQQAKQSPSQ